MPYVPKLHLDGQHAAAEMQRLAAYVNAHTAAINNIAAIATADGTDAATTQTLANDTKAKVNALITAMHGIGIVASVTLIATADGTDAATTQALANATKAKVNALLAAMVAEGTMAP